MKRDEIEANENASKLPTRILENEKTLSFPLLEDDKLWKQERERERDTVSGHKDRPLIKTSERERGEEMESASGEERKKSEGG